MGSLKSKEKERLARNSNRKISAAEGYLRAGSENVKQRNRFIILLVDTEKIFAFSTGKDNN